jgi:hypothetical protein
VKILITIFASMFFTNIAEACRCSTPEPTEENISHYQNIARVVLFELKIVNFIEATKEDMAAEGKIKVLEIYKGSTEPMLSFKSSEFLSSCGKNLELGRDYILAWNEEISLNSCSINWIKLNRIRWPEFKGNRPPLVNRLTSAEIIQKINGKNGL